MRDGSINLDGFHKAASRINGHVRNTPLLDSKPLKNDLVPSGSLFLKLENLQPTGSFKVRGAINTLKTLSEMEKNKGLITCISEAFDIDWPSDFEMAQKLWTEEKRT